jgi:transposase
MSSTVEIVGIDIGARTLVVSAETLPLAASFDNTAHARGALLASLQASPLPVRVVMEATGIYFLDLACELAAGGVAVMVVNPKAAHHFAEALLERRKDDPVDARMLRAYGRRMPFVPWQPPAAVVFQLRAIGRQIQAFGKDGAAARNRLHALAATGLTSPALRQAVEAHVAQIETLVGTLIEQATRLLAQAPELRRKVELVDSIPGFADKAAIIVAGELAGLPTSMAAPQWVAQAGLDVREERSGTSLAKRPRLSKRGNRRLRQALFHPAMTAVRCCPQARAFHDRLVAAGKTPLQAICAVMRKLLHAIHAMWRSDQTFDPAKLFAPAPQATAIPLFDQNATIPPSRPAKPTAARTAVLKARLRRPPKAAQSGLDCREHDAELITVGSTSP